MADEPKRPSHIAYHVREGQDDDLWLGVEYERVGEPPEQVTTSAEEVGRELLR